MTRNDYLRLLGFAGFLLLCWAAETILWPKDSLDKFIATLKARDTGACPAESWAYGPGSGKWQMHYGLDLASPRGTRVSAVTDGTVVFAGLCGSYGNVVILRHEGDVITLYAHLLDVPPGLRQGVAVREGDAIGHVGPPARLKASKLHFEVWEERAAQQSHSGPGRAARPPLSTAREVN